ncbi:MAG TPA: hypothetical protein VKQ30_20930 [Ktedonobacterales bacterium]|nr:hypothetical protein [Ktedonobacterales bacterium]
MKIHHTTDYAQARRMEYPPLEELADALYHQAQGDSSKLAAYLEKVGKVKQRIKKPSGA